MADEYVDLYCPCIRVYIVQAHTVIKTSDDELVAHNFSHVYRNLVPSYLLLIPEEDHLIFVTGYQNTADNHTHSDWFLVVGGMGNHNV